MNHKFHTPKMMKSNQPQVGFHQVSSGVSATPKKKHISYSTREDYILDIEKQLMSKYRVGYSGLHKMLVVKEGNQQFGRPFV